MKKAMTLKKALTFLLTLSMLLCCVGAFGSVQASAATDRVSMYLYDPYFSKYGATSANIYVQTKDNASNQQVYVHYNFMNGEWKDQQADYVTTLDDGSKIWKASISSYNMEYVIKYVADGQVIWDNNNGQNYKTQYLGTAPLTVLRTGFVYPDEYPIEVVLKNYAFQKNVFVRYTENNWASYKDVPLTYQSTNADGTENWKTTLNVDSSKLDSFAYAVCYKVNGQTYWANNFGANYNADYIMHS